MTLKWNLYEPSRHLSRSEIYPPDPHCPICGHVGPRQTRQALQEDPDIELLSCPHCFGLSASQMPRREVLDAIYASYYADHGGDAGVIFQDPSRLARHILAMSKPIARRNGEFRIVDFGGGSGVIARAVGSLVADRTCRSILVQVIDYGDAPKSREGAVEMHFLRDLSDAATECDLVIASGSLEHVPDLALVLPALLGKLRSGGLFYARTSYYLPLMKIFGFDMNFPAHVHDLGDEFWSRVPKWLPVEIALSRPSIVESSWDRDFVRTLLAHCLKFPSRVESLWTRNPFFKLYGGWEVLLRRRPFVMLEREQ
jgi:SAM-dependent methyltransferase